MVLVPDNINAAFIVGAGSDIVAAAFQRVEAHAGGGRAVLTHQLVFEVTEDAGIQGVQLAQVVPVIAGVIHVPDLQHAIHEDALGILHPQVERRRKVYLHAIAGPDAHIGKRGVREDVRIRKFPKAHRYAGTIVVVARSAPEAGNDTDSVYILLRGLILRSESAVAAGQYMPRSIIGICEQYAIADDISVAHEVRVGPEHDDLHAAEDRDLRPRLSGSFISQKIVVPR